MSERDVVIGIDTSNYTTSVAILGTDGELIANVKRLLTVTEGQCGLRQSDALFAHIKNLPLVMREVESYLIGAKIKAVGVSTRPRNVDGSYMPVFLAGASVAESLSAMLGVPLYSFSHQCGHVMAALYSSGRLDLMNGSFAAVHVSGGTTELLRVRKADVGFDTELVGGTLDLNAGQVIDRIGVMLGMPFPAGPYLEREALKFTGKHNKRKLSGDAMHVNLSGLENMAEKMHREGVDAPEIAHFVLDYVGRAIIKIIKDFISVYGDTTTVCAGGVMCNSIIKGMLMREFDVCFAEPSMSSDNAVGIAALTLDALKAGKNK